MWLTIFLYERYTFVEHLENNVKIHINEQISMNKPYTLRKQCIIYIWYYRIYIHSICNLLIVIRIINLSLFDDGWVFGVVFINNRLTLNVYKFLLFASTIRTHILLYPTMPKYRINFEYWISNSILYIRKWTKPINNR